MSEQRYYISSADESKAQSPRAEDKKLSDDDEGTTVFRALPPELLDILDLIEARAGEGLPKREYFDAWWKDVRRPLDAALFYAEELNWPVFPCCYKLTDGSLSKPP